MILGGLGALLVVAIIAFFVVSGGDDDKDDVASGNSSTTQPTDSVPEIDDPTDTTIDDEDEPTTTTEPESSSGELELPEPIDGYQVYEADSGEYALTFPDDWTVGDASSINADAMLVANAPPVDGFTPNLNMLTVAGATDGEFDYDDFGQIQSDALADAPGFENVAYEDVQIGDRDGIVITYTLEQGSFRGDGYQYYAPGQDEMYILTVTVPEGADRTVADNIGTSLRVL